jgi:hypothetical protein
LLTDAFEKTDNFIDAEIRASAFTKCYFFKFFFKPTFYIKLKERTRLAAPPPPCLQGPSNIEKFKLKISLKANISV